jgi:hypothetical protein
MKPVQSTNEVEDRDFQALEEYLGLLIRIFDIAKDAGLLPIILHLNNKCPGYKKRPHAEQIQWWVYAEGFDLLEQPPEF